MARPTKYRKDYCEQLLEHMKEGLSFESFAAIAQVNQDTLHEWCKRFEEFSEAKKRGREAQRLFYEKIGRAASIGKLDGFNPTAFVWMTKNMLGWRDKQDIVHSGPEGGPITTVELSAEERAERINYLLKTRELLADESETDS